MSNRIGPVIAFLVCDQVITCKNTLKSTCVGIFDTINSMGFPFARPEMAIFARIADVDGYHVGRIEIRDPEDKVLDKIGPFECQQAKTATLEIVLSMVNVAFERPGVHQLQLYLDGHMVASSKLILNLLSQKVG